jgi:hypothetical protein
MVNSVGLTQGSSGGNSVGSNLSANIQQIGNQGYV